MEKKEEKKDEAALKRIAEIYRHEYGSYFVHYFEEKSNNLFFFNMKEDKGKVIPIKDFQTPDQFDSVQVMNRIFLGGGYKIDKAKPDFLSGFYECTLPSSKECLALISERASMINTRAQHVYCAIRGGWIYCMGGKNNASGKLTYLDSVERYDIVKDAWSPAPALTEKKMNLSACAFSQRYIYCFGGYNYSLGGALQTIEFLDSENEAADWKRYEITKQMAKSWFAHFWMGCYHFATDKIIVFGGNNTDASFIFNVALGTLERCERQISFRVNFCQRKAELYKNEVKCVDYQRKDVNVFQIEKYWWNDHDHEWAFYPRKPIKLPDHEDY